VNQFLLKSSLGSMRDESSLFGPDIDIYTNITLDSVESDTYNEIAANYYAEQIEALDVVFEDGRSSAFTNERAFNFGLAALLCILLVIVTFISMQLLTFANPIGLMCCYTSICRCRPDHCNACATSPSAICAPVACCIRKEPEANNDDRPLTNDRCCSTCGECGGACGDCCNNCSECRCQCGCMSCCGRTAAARPEAIDRCDWGICLTRHNTSRDCYALFWALLDLTVYFVVCMTVFLAGSAAAGYPNFDSTLVHTNLVLPRFLSLALVPGVIAALVQWRWPYVRMMKLCSCKSLTIAVFDLGQTYR
jgi:hypothetical protein